MELRRFPGEVSPGFWYVDFWFLQNTSFSWNKEHILYYYKSKAVSWIVDKSGSYNDVKVQSRKFSSMVQPPGADFIFIKKGGGLK